MNDMKYDEANQEYSRQTQQKFEFYFIALVFTILALSIQTSVMTELNWQRFFELLSWVCLLLSGLSGLSRLEWVAVVFRLFGNRQTETRNAEKHEQAMAGGSIQNIDGSVMTKEEMIKMKKHYKDNIDLMTKEISRIEKWLSIKYEVHKWGFVIGLCSLIISRAMQKLMV